MKKHPADQVERWDIEKLIPYANNSRTHSDEQVTQLAASMKEWGITSAVLVDEEGGIIAGHGRVMAAKRLGMKDLPVMVAKGWTEAQKKAFVIADNKLAQNAGWDAALLSLEFDALRADGFDVDLIGFSDEELEAMRPKEIVEGLTDEDDVPELKPEATTKLGDIWLLGSHRVMCGDSTNIDALKRVCLDGLVDMWLTDPPYNVAYKGKTKDALEIKNDEMTDDQFLQFLRDACSAADTVMKPGAVFYIWHADSEGYNFRAAIKDAGWKLRQCLIWKKQTMVLGRQDYQWKHEPCLYGWKDGASHLWANDRKQTTILEFNKPARSEQHPTMKPVELFSYQMLNNTKIGDVVLDSFGGSGTTLLAAEQNRRVARLIELDPKYCDVIIRRWQDFTGKKAVLESNGKTFEEVAGG